MATDSENSNGISPSKANKVRNNAKKRARYDNGRKLDTSTSSFDENTSEELLKQKQKNKDLQFIIGKMQGQLDVLTKRIEDLTNVMLDLQNEKKKLVELLEKKSSPNKKQKKAAAVKSATNNIRNKTTHSNTAPPKPNETNNQVKNDGENANEQDNNTLQSTSEHTPLDQADAHTATPVELSGKDEENEIEMKSDDKQSESESDEETDDDTDENNVVDDEGFTVMRNEKNTQKNKRSTKVPPVDIWTDNRAEIQREIQATLPKDSCLFGRVNNGKFRVFTNDAPTRLVLIEFLKKKSITFNTYTPSDEKMVNVLIKGLDHIDDSDAIKDALALKGFEPIKIQKHITGYMRKNNIKSNLWLIVLQPNTDTNELFKIKAIDRAIVKFDFLRKPKVIQCRRCQRFNHSASNCMLPYRCVKCTDDHEPGKCKSVTNKNKFKPKCVNCQGNHTANDAANCDAFKKAIELKTSKTKKVSNKQTNKQTSNSSTKSYATIAKPKQQKVNDRETVNINNFINTQNNMLSEFMSTIQKMQQQFITTFTCKNGQRN